MKQPVSVFTNALYLVPAYFAMVSTDVTLQLFGVACVVLALGSGLYHYAHGAGHPKEQEWRLWDHRGMYLVMATALGHIAYLSDTNQVIALFAGAALGALLAAFAKALRQRLVVITGAMIVLAVLGIAFSLSVLPALLVAALSGGAYFIRQKTNVAHAVESGREDWGHGIWHLLTAAALMVVTYL